MFDQAGTGVGRWGRSRTIRDGLALVRLLIFSWRQDVAKALVGHFVAPDPIAAAQVRALRQRVEQLEARVILLEAELAATTTAEIDTALV